MALSRALKPPAISNCERDGNLSVQSGTTWKRVFAVLKNQTLQLYESPKDLKPLQSLPMPDGTVRPVDAARVRKRGVFEVRNDDAAVTLQAESQEERDQWMSALLIAAAPAKWPLGVVYTGAPEDAGVVRALPRLKEVAPYQRRAVLLRKLLLCAVTFDFRSDTAHLEEKEGKRQALLELVDYCDTVRGAFNDPAIFVDVITMVSLNIFRALPHRPELAGEEDDEEEPFMEPSWPHLSIVYEFLLHLVQSQQIELAHKKKGVDAKFVRRLLPLFHSDDLRERDYLKTITHRIYGKLTHRRAAIRRAISNVFYDFIYEDTNSNGIAELLEILASIINGFAVPIKQEHKSMLIRALIPLHKNRGLGVYHAQLTYCMTLYVAKEPALMVPIMSGILKYWPYGSSSKEMLFLNEVEELFESMQARELEELAPSLFSRLARCIESAHFQVAERALWLWNCRAVVELTVDSPQMRQIVLPVVFRGLYENSTNHWHESVKQLSQHVLALYMEADASFYEMCVRKHEPAGDA